MGSRIRNDRLSDVAGSGADVSRRQKPLSAGIGTVAGALRASLRFLIVLGSSRRNRHPLWRAACPARISTDPRRSRPLAAAFLCAIAASHGCSAGVPGLARPTRGLICSNHLSYLDILAYAAAVPCIFISRSDVRRWPVFGWCARAGGTIFIDRQSRASTERVARQMAEALEAGVPILLFPEGTSTDGSSVLRFHPSLLEPAIHQEQEITAAAISLSRSRGRGTGALLVRRYQFCAPPAAHSGPRRHRVRGRVSPRSGCVYRAEGRGSGPARESGGDADPDDAGFALTH